MMNPSSDSGKTTLTPSTVRVRETRPEHAVPGGRLVIRGEGFDPKQAHACRVYFGDVRGQVTRVSSDTLTVIVPDGAQPLLRIEMNGVATDPVPVSIAETLADQLHPVANPVIDPEGSVYVTLSGARGEQTPVSIYCIGVDGQVTPFVSDIVNATGLAWGPDDCLYISSREEGTVYRVGQNRNVEELADELGVATGLAFDAEGILYVGDRRGTVFRIEPNGEPRAFCHLEPSVAAYHLAFDRGGDLFVTAPSLSTQDPIYRVARDGTVGVFSRGFGRPQGLAFGTDGNLYVTEALAGDSGVYRVATDGSMTRVVTSPPLVGLAFDDNGGLVLAGTSSVFRLDMGVTGLL